MANTSFYESIQVVKNALDLNYKQLEQLYQLKDVLNEKLEENAYLLQSLNDDETGDLDEVNLDEPSESSTRSTDLPTGLQVFAYPYFKDDRGFTEPDNEDTIKMRQMGYSNSRSFELTKSNWTKNECANLEKQILTEAKAKSVADINELKNQLVRRLEVLESVVDSESPIEEFNKIARIKEQITLQNSIINERLSEVTIPSREESENLDWLRISACMSSSFTDLDCKLKWINELHPDINKDEFSSEEIEQIKQLAIEHNENWYIISDKISKPGKLRLPWQICKYYQSNLNRETKRAGPLSDNEKELLELLINEYTDRDTGEIAWHRVKYHMNGRTVSQLKLYWTKKNSLKKGKPWTQLEDLVLAGAVKKFGKSSWDKVCQYVYGRTNRQCRERYMLRLDIPDRKGGDWKKEEDEKILRLAHQYDFKWVEVQKEMPHRNAKQISTRYALINSWIETKQESKLFRNSNSKGERNTVQVEIKSMSHDIIEQKLRKEFSSDEKLTKFLEESREKLKQSFEKSHEVSILPLVEEAEEVAVDRELTEFFAYHDEYEKKKTRVCLTANDTTLYDTLSYQLSLLINGQQLEPSNPLEAVTSSLITKQVSSLVTRTKEDGSTSGFVVLPPNLVTLRGLQGLFLQEDRLKKNIQDAGLDIEELLSQFTLKDSSYSKLFRRFLSLFYWPLICSMENAPSLPQLRGESSNQTSHQSSSTASFIKEKKALASKLTSTRDGQNLLFRSAVGDGNKLTQVFKLVNQQPSDQAILSMSADEIESILTFPQYNKSNSPSNIPTKETNEPSNSTVVRKATKRKTKKSSLDEVNSTTDSQIDLSVSSQLTRKSGREKKQKRFFDD